MPIPMPYILYGVVGAGLALVLARLVLAVMRDINVPEMTKVTIKLLLAGEPDRVINLCHAAPRARFVRLILPAVEAFQQDGDLGSARSTFERGYGDLLRRTGRELIFGGVGIFVAALALIFGLRLGYRPPAYLVLCGVTGLLGVALIRKMLALRSQSRAGFEKIAGALEVGARS